MQDRKLPRHGFPPLGPLPTPGPYIGPPTHAPIPVPDGGDNLPHGLLLPPDITVIFDEEFEKECNRLRFKILPNGYVALVDDNSGKEKTTNDEDDTEISNKE